MQSTVRMGSFVCPFTHTRTMIFGNPKDFAIEAYQEPSGPQWGGFGRMAIDIQGVRLGDIRENHCSLFHAADRFREVYPHIESLWAESFDGLSDAEIFALIDTRYTGEPCEEDYSLFDFLTNTGEQFDDAKTFIICRPDGQVRILYQLRDGTIGSASCSTSSFREVAEAFVCWFDEQVRATAPLHFPQTHFPDSLPASLNGEDTGIAEATRRDAELDRDPSAGMTLDEFKAALGH